MRVRASSRINTIGPAYDRSRGSGLVLIVGVGRSGTSLVQSMMAAHSSVAGAPETSILRRLLLSGVLDKAFYKSGLTGAKQILLEDGKLKRHEQCQQCISMLSTTGDESTIDLYLHLVRCFAGGRRVKFVLDKDPKLVENLASINSLLPDAHIVHVFRDPRDVLFSKQRAEWSSKYPDWRHIVAARAQMSLWKRFSQRNDRRCSISEIRYESLIADPRSEIKKVCDDLGLEFEENMLTYFESSGSLISDEELSWKKETMQPIMEGNKGKWIGNMPRSKVLLCERVCVNNLSQGKYSVSKLEGEISGIRRLHIGLLSMALRVVADLFVVAKEILNRRDVRRLRWRLRE